MYAVNFADLTKYYEDDLMLALLLSDILDDGTIINAEPGRIDGFALALNCDDGRAEAVIEWVQGRLGYHPNALRFYRQGKRGAWTRVRR